MPSTALQNHIKCDAIYSAKMSFKLIQSLTSVINLILLIIPQFSLNVIASAGA